MSPHAGPVVRCDAYLMSVYKLLFEWFVVCFQIISRPVCGPFDLNILQGGIANAFQHALSHSFWIEYSQFFLINDGFQESLGKNVNVRCPQVSGPGSRSQF